jgi:hypothetical protein
VVFRVLRERKPVLPDVLAVNLEDQHATLLGSDVMGALLRRLGGIQVVCAVVVIVGTGLQFAVANVSGQNLAAGVVRVGLAALAAVVLGYDRWVLSPRLEKARETYIANADSPELANPARDAFDRDQQKLLTLVMVMAALLAGLVLFSAAVTPKAAVSAFQ